MFSERIQVSHAARSNNLFTNNLFILQTYSSISKLIIEALDQSEPRICRIQPMKTEL